MKRILFVLIFLVSAKSLFGQNTPKEYTEKVKKAEAFYDAKDFKSSANNYSEAFKSNGWKASLNDRYNAACSWAMASVPDSAFSQLDKVAVKFINYNHITTDTDLSSLHTDKRWKPLVEKIKQNQEKAEASLNKPLVTKLSNINEEDQKYRQQIEGIEKKYGADSKEMQEHWKTIAKKDSVNLIEVKAILDKYGWLGPDVVGAQGSITLFLVIQHADLATQEKYLPMMREAVKNGKAQSSSLALLEDRVALRQGKKQIYGSQIGRDPETQLYFVSPLEDPDNVDKRRAEVGLPPLAEYVKNWQIKWDVEQYKKDLPKLENKSKRK
ncbi:DUF6624 domain-containing protein [Chryseobacterium paridis]|uniref:DUF4034 domain-containing protein n=1 Tax=Chryseobacterium paridis TaxID=2800328 RepID=A0ABS1FPK7_9FLAO|nr:DUF6624 domain-containing protein [Chryseobacterium paridis]MBK1894345.1 hypothetical protein [Chryseobacterium paridis]